MPSLFQLPKTVAVSGAASYPGSKLYFYSTGTTNLADVYTDSALSVAHASPVVADSDGVFAPIYLDPAVAYKVTWKDSAGSLIYTVDPASDSLSADTIGRALYPRTAAEVSAGVMPVIYEYPPNDIRRYGGIGDASTANDSALTSALLVAYQTDSEVFIPTEGGRVYLFSSGVILDGDSTGTKIVSDGHAIFRFTGLSGSTDCVTVDGGSAYRQVLLRNIEIDCDGGGRDGLVILSGEKPIFDNVHIIDSGRDALALNCSGYNFVENADFDIFILYAGRHGIRLETSGSNGAFINENLWRQIEIRGVSYRVNSGRAIFMTSTATSPASKFSNQLFLKSNFDCIYNSGAAYTPSANIVEADSGTVENLRFLSGGWENTGSGTITGGYSFIASGTANWAGLTVDSMITNSLWGNLGVHASVLRVWNFDFSRASTTLVGPVSIGIELDGNYGVDVSGNSTTYTKSEFRGIRTGSAVDSVGRGANILIGNDTTSTYLAMQEHSGACVVYTYSSGAWGERCRILPDGSLIAQGYLSIGDGITAPSTVSGKASIYVDNSDGDLKVKFGDGTVKTIVVDS